MPSNQPKEPGRRNAVVGLYYGCLFTALIALAIVGLIALLRYWL